MDNVVSLKMTFDNLAANTKKSVTIRYVNPNLTNEKLIEMSTAVAALQTGTIGNKLTKETREAIYRESY